MYRILSVSRDARLLFARNDALAAAGFRVIAPATPTRAPHLVAGQNIDAVVLGHSLSPKTRQHIIRKVRQIDPCCPIFFVYEHPDTGGEPLADLSIEVTHGSDTLVNELTGGRAPARVQTAAVGRAPVRAARLRKSDGAAAQSA